MVKKRCPGWSYFELKTVHWFCPSGAKYSAHHILSLKAFFKTEKKEKEEMDSAMTSGAK
jgi:hypothetical protein